MNNFICISYVLAVVFVLLLFAAVQTQEFDEATGYVCQSLKC